MKSLLSRTRRGLFRILWRANRRAKTGVIGVLARRCVFLERQRWAGMMTIDGQRQALADAQESLAFTRAQLRSLDINTVVDDGNPRASGTYLVWLSGARVWHEAYWSSTGWRVLVRSGAPVTHWRRMPPGPADRPLPYTPPTAGECAR